MGILNGMRLRAAFVYSSEGLHSFKAAYLFDKEKISSYCPLMNFQKLSTSAKRFSTDKRHLEISFLLDMVCLHILYERSDPFFFIIALCCVTFIKKYDSSSHNTTKVH